MCSGKKCNWWSPIHKSYSVCGLKVVANEDNHYTHKNYEECPYYDFQAGGRRILKAKYEYLFEVEEEE